MKARTITPKQSDNQVTTLQRCAKNDRITDSFNIYGDLIRKLAGGITESPEEAEKVVREIFLDLWQNADRAAITDFDEIIFISIMARRHLIERTNKSQQIN